ncbi:MAG: S-layer protein [Candidatus Woesearchaeota archaeon]
MRNYNKKLFLSLGIMLVFTIFYVNSADIIVERLDLEEYPNFFINNDRLDVSFVVGEFAKSADVISTAVIANSLQENLRDIVDRGETDLFQIDVTDGNVTEELTKLYMDVFNKKRDSAANTILDTSLTLENLKDKNLIVVGGPCVNWVAAHFHGNPEHCADGYTPGRGFIRLYPNGKGVVMVVAGYAAEDTLQAANIVANHRDYSSNFVGTQMRVLSAIIHEVKIQ